ncbi:ATP-dependent RNA helicase dbp10 [Aureobasidium sp. EXF-3400]|nr:ATP-dependent RNA helicase dbp10 [Aureobasidium sp. EXF-12344]KAI4769277.1 ATP-dependent RNA helicase dbp10 [Aureobasidium sp. EXF-3400]
MGGRAVSPTASENGYELSNALFGGVDLDSDDDQTLAGFEQPKPATLDASGGAGLDDDSDGDELYIAAQQAANNRKTKDMTGKTIKKGGGFQSMGLNGHLLKAITRKGFSRKTIPVILDGQDVVGMARTGSGKTAAFVIPMIEKLKSHSAKVGARAVILSPSRELALQTLRVVKEMGKGTDLRTILLVGGDSLEEQFSSMASNPDIIIATPGRFEHLKIEMNLDLSSIRYIVFDEADRLFEMGFAAQLAEIMVALPPNRQTLLFSATLPRSLVEFARAGLQEPKLIRLDAETKISPDLQTAYFSINTQEKEGALVHILRDVIKMPSGPTERTKQAKEDSMKNKKRKRGPEGPGANETPTEHSTIVFAATKHHVEYLYNMLGQLGYAVSYVYGALDQTARKIQIQEFRSGLTNILVVTDVAARGVDIPILANVINYDFPSQPKIFVHRVGRTARAGKKGWAYSLVTQKDLPYLLDLQLFLSRKLVLGREPTDEINYADQVVLGTLVRAPLEICVEEVGKLVDDDVDLTGIRDVSVKAEKQYVRTRTSASSESAKRAKVVGSSPHYSEIHTLFEDDSEARYMELEREKMLARVSGFRPPETIFEVGKRGGGNEATEIMRNRRAKIQPRKQLEKAKEMEEMDEDTTVFENDDDDLPEGDVDVDLDEASEDELEITFSQPEKKKAKSSGAGQDSEFFMSYTPQNINMAEDRGYGVHSGTDGGRNTHFLDAARGATMDLANDDTKAFGAPSKAGGQRWDSKSRKYVSRANDEDGSKGTKMITGESGLKIAASFRSGRFDRWRKDNKLDVLPRVGELERPGNRNGLDNQRFKHNMVKAPKDADKYRDDYHKQQAKVDAAKEKRVGRFESGPGKSEIRGVDDVHKLRQEAQKRQDKNARPQGSSSRGRGGGGRGGRGGPSRGGSSSRGSSRGGSSRGGGGFGDRGSSSGGRGGRGGGRGGGGRGGGRGRGGRS